MGYTKNRISMNREDNYVWVSSHELTGYEEKVYHSTYPTMRANNENCKVWIATWEPHEVILRKNAFTIIRSKETFKETIKLK